VRRLPQAVRRPVEHDVAHAPTLGRQAVRVRRVRQVVHQKAPPEDAHELPHGHQAVLVRQVRTELQPEQQHEDAPEKMQCRRDTTADADVATTATATATAATTATSRRRSGIIGRTTRLNEYGGCSVSSGSTSPPPRFSNKSKRFSSHTFRFVLLPLTALATDFRPQIPLLCSYYKRYYNL